MSFRSILALQNSIQYYDWGSKTAIPELLGKSNPMGKPMAEMWMGAHPKAPSKIRVRDQWVSIENVIRSSPETVLGMDVARTFGNRLPFLFKVLAAEKPLSIQVHPDMDQARQGFEDENRLAVPLNASDRNYRDRNHKPEVIYALGTFDALKGFRNVGEMIRLLERVSSPVLKEALKRLKIQPDSSGLRAFFSDVLRLEHGQKMEMTAYAARRAAKYAADDPAFHWVIGLQEAYPGDAGVLSPLFLNFVRLSPGQALHLPAGELHAYLKGVGIELMANSDNVVRGGLTSKHVDVQELLKITRFTGERVRILDSREGPQGEQAYPTPAREFLLSRIRVDGSRAHVSAAGSSIQMLLCTEGEGDILELASGERMSFRKGMSFVVPAALPGYRIEGCGIFFSASVPPSHHHETVLS